MHSDLNTHESLNQQSKAAHAGWQKRKQNREALPGEEWRPVPSFPGYEASSFGRVRSAYTLLTATPNRHGYPFVSPSVGGRQKPMAAHRLIAEAFHGPCPVGMECRHLDGDRLNNRPENLKWGSRRENQLDRIDHGTTNRGEANGKARLTADQAREVGDLIKAGFRNCDIAKMTGVSAGNVGLIKMGRSWAEVTGIPRTYDPGRLNRRYSNVTFLTRDQSLAPDDGEGADK